MNLNKKKYMWVNEYQPTIGDWYIIKINGKKKLLMWNNHNKVFTDIAGKTYSFNDIDCWLDDSKVKMRIRNKQ